LGIKEKIKEASKERGRGREQVKKRNLNFSHIGGLNLVGKFKPRQIMSNESANFWPKTCLVICSFGVGGGCGGGDSRPFLLVKASNFKWISESS